MMTAPLALIASWAQTLREMVASGGTTILASVVPEGPSLWTPTGDVSAYMVSAVHHLQILRTVVQRVVIDVMDMLVWSKDATQRVARDYPMLRFPTVITWASLYQPVISTTIAAGLVLSPNGTIVPLARRKTHLHGGEV